MPLRLSCVCSASRTFAEVHTGNFRAIIQQPCVCGLTEPCLLYVEALELYIRIARGLMYNLFQFYNNKHIGYNNL